MRDDRRKLGQSINIKSLNLLVDWWRKIERSNYQKKNLLANVQEEKPED